MMILPLLWICLAQQALGAVNVRTAEGVLSSVYLDVDSCRIVVGGKTFTSGSGDFEVASDADRAALEAAFKKAPGRHWPTVGDLHARVQVFYVTQGGTDVLLKYRVLSRPPQTWFVILASETTAERAWPLKMRAREAGFMADVIRSSEYPRLKSGYFVVIGGAFVDSASAASTLQRARSAGWPGAYIKRAR